MRGSRSCVSSYLFSPFDQSVTRCRYGSRWSLLAVSPAILVVADLFHPVDEGLPIDQFLNGAICVIAVVGVAPCQCFSPGGIQMTSPGWTSDLTPKNWT